MPGVSEGRVCIFGAGGPMGSSIIGPLSESYTLRLADLATESEIRSRTLMKGAPAHPELNPPHEWVQVDVTEYDDVERAVRECDAVINVTVNRKHRPSAFRVNAGGAYNIFRASVAFGVARVIHTGPIHVESMDFEGDYRFDFNLDEGAPFRPGADLYGITKHLSYEIADSFAREHDLDVITFIVSRLRPHDQYDDRDGNVVIPFSTAWDDLASAFLAGLRAPRMPHPNERFYICADLPMGKYTAEKAERLLGWKARHRFEDFYSVGPRPREGEPPSSSGNTSSRSRPFQS